MTITANIIKISLSLDCCRSAVFTLVVIRNEYNFKLREIFSSEQITCAINILVHQEFNSVCIKYECIMMTHDCTPLGGTMNIAVMKDELARAG